jgi:hypothetical protein
MAHGHIYGKNGWKEFFIVLRLVFTTSTFFLEFNYFFDANFNAYLKIESMVAAPNKNKVCDIQIQPNP